MKIILLLGIALCVYAADVEESKTDKRQSHGEVTATRLVYRIPRKQDQGIPVEEPQQEEDKEPASRTDTDEYRPGQVFSLNAQELLELQPERQAPLTSNQLLQQLYQNPQQEHKQNLQQFYYLDPQLSRQVALQPSHAVIARPTHTSNGGEASVGAALSVSDTGASSTNSFNHELLALLGQAPVRQEEHHKQSFAQSVQSQQPSTVQSVAPQYQQVDRYVTKPSKKPTKHRSKVQVIPPNIPAAPQQYLIETTNVQAQQQSQQTHQQFQAQAQFHPAPQPQRVAQALRYVPFQQSQQLQQSLYERPESQGLKIVEAPKLQQVNQPRAQVNYRFIPQYLPEAAPKQYRLVDAPKPHQIKQEQPVQSSNVDRERPVTYLKRYPETEKLRSVKIYDPVQSEGLQSQPAQIGSDQYVFRPIYRTNDPRSRYEITALPSKPESQRVAEAIKPQSAIYVSKHLAPRKISRPQLPSREHNVDIEEAAQKQQFSIGQPSNVEQVNIEQHGQSIDEQRSHLPPPKNNKAYTPEEFAALVAAGYAVTPVPVSALNLDIAQSRADVESSQLALPAQSKHRPIKRRPLYLPLRGDDAP